MSSMPVVAISGSTRARSVNTAVVETLGVLDPGRVRPFRGLAGLPAFDPDVDDGSLPEAVGALRAALASCSAVVFCTPEYAGALPGSLKNLLDWTVGGFEMPGLAAGWVNVASVAAPSGGAGAHGELRTVLGYVGARIVDAACVRVPLSRDQVGEDGLIADPALRETLRAVLDALP